MPIDTHEGYKQLVEAGVPEPQAEAMLRLFSGWVNEELATKQDLELLRRDLSNLEGRFDKKLSDMEKRLNNRILTVVGAATTILSTLIIILSFVT